MTTRLFTSWVRRGLAAGIAEPDPGSGPYPGPADFSPQSPWHETAQRKLPRCLAQICLCLARAQSWVSISVPSCGPIRHQARPGSRTIILL